MSDKLFNNNDVSYNKRQFWEYKRLYGGPYKNLQTRNNKILNNTLTKTSNNTSNNTSKSNNNITKKIFHLVNNKIATNKNLINRLSSIYIPPAYKNIVVAKSAINKIQAIGTDTRGRRQYVYNPQYTKKRNERKYEDIMELGKNIVSIEQYNLKMLNILVKKNIEDWVFPDDYIPIIVYMLRTYHFRIGNERYVNDNKSYGITTLRNDHVIWNKDKKNFTIEFIGKKGILNSFSDNNPIIAKLLKQLIEQSRRTNNEGYLFKYKLSNASNASNEFMFISPEHIQDFFKQQYNSYITPKMFRTWYGNKHLLECLRHMYNTGKLIGKSHTKMNIHEKNEIIKECSVYVSNKLNNTPTVSKQSYIDNKILDLVMRNPRYFATKIPDNSDEQHKYLYKIILKLRN